MAKKPELSRTRLKWCSHDGVVEAVVTYSHNRAGIWTVETDEDGIVRVEFDGTLLATAPNNADGRQYAECAAAALGHRP